MPHDFGLQGNPCGQLQRFAFGGTRPAAVHWRPGHLRHRHQMIGAEGLAASIAMELIAAGAEHRAAISVGAEVDFQEDVPAVFVIFDGEAIKEGVAGGTGGGVEWEEARCLTDEVATI